MAERSVDSLVSRGEDAGGKSTAYIHGGKAATGLHFDLTRIAHNGRFSSLPRSQAGSHEARCYMTSCQPKLSKTKVEGLFGLQMGGLIGVLSSRVPSQHVVNDWLRYGMVRLKSSKLCQGS